MIDFNNMTGVNQKIYKCMWDDFDFADGYVPIESTGTEGSNGSNGPVKSYRFTGDADKENLLKKVFGISQPTLFHEKFIQATNGSGQEISRITTLHSSALCPLLFFYNVSGKNPLKLILETNAKQRPVVFTDSVFEFKSPVYNNPSNMDVVLTGRDMVSGEEVVFFLESKFSEYITDASLKSGEISDKYLKGPYSKPFYDKAILEELNLAIRKNANTDTDKFLLESSGNEGKFYITGIKQLISHYVGIQHLLKRKFYHESKNDVDADNSEIMKINGRKQEKLKEKIETGSVVILGEILFDYRIDSIKNRQGISFKQLYCEKYKILAAEMATVNNNPKFEIVKGLLGYSLFKSNMYNLDKEVRRFYSV